MIILFEWLIYLKLMICLRNTNKESVKTPLNCAFITFTLLKDYSEVKGHPCKVSTNENANCQDLPSPLETIPQDLDINLKHLNLDNNTIKKLNGESFKKYINLVSLTMNKVKVEESVLSDYIFRPLEKLEELSLSSFTSPSQLNYYWPKSLKIFNVSHNEAITSNAILNVVELNNLEILDASNNYFLNIPILNMLAPIKYIDLRNNPLPGITVENVAHYCNVHQMEIDISVGSELTSSDKYCSCLIANEWFKLYIKSEKNFTCAHHDAASYTCNLTFPQVALNNREECLKKQPKSKQNFYIMLAVVGLIIVLVAVLTVVFAHGYRVLRKKVEEGELALTDGTSKEKTTVEDVLEEDEDTDEA